MKIRKIESHETGHIVWKKINQTCCQSVPTADRPHWKNKLNPLTRRRSATQLLHENLHLNDFESTSWVNGSRVLVTHVTHQDLLTHLTHDP